MKAVRYVGKAANLPEAYIASLAAGSGYTVVDSLPRGANVTLRLTIDTKPLEVTHDALTRDFLDLATLVYIVDEIEPRGDDWTRQFNVLFPVKNHEHWAVNQQGLTQLLATLAGDKYQFQWCERPALSGFGAHRQSLPTGYDAVCLFSGGIDSFLGAHRLLSQGKKLLLCGHQADGTAASAQKKLADILRVMFPGQLKLIQCRVARSFGTTHRFPLPQKCEETHRPRSLLFLGLAIALANAAKIDTVYMAENGLIALNPPLGKSRLGTLSTRTAHPKYLIELTDFMKASGIFTGRIKNPFLFDSKTDMLRGLDPALAPALLRSVSCARPSRFKNLGVRHCGYCIPCLYRRVAMAEAGLDSPSDYGFKLFEKIDSVDSAKQMDFRALVSFARRVVTSTPLNRDLIVLSHGFFPVDAAERFGDKKTASHSVWGDMFLRWADDFLKKLNVMASAETRRLLGIKTV
jgi:7-cyano-7-deazaguanine synthase in queuosine biosynthesis